MTTTQAAAKLFGALVIYYTLSYIGMRKIITLDCQRDYFKAPFIPWTVPFANAFPIATVIYRIYQHKNIATYLTRAAALYILKGVIQFVTLVPAVSGTGPCQTRTLLGVLLMSDNCADMMFSGHTGLVYIMAPQKERPLFVLAVGICLVLAEMHYTSDILVAIIVGSWLEYMIPMPTKKTNQTKTLTDISLKI
jgi:hypothetical protein